MMEKNEPKRFLSIRLTSAELTAIQSQCKSSGCHSLTEYTKKVLMKKAVVTRIRNESTAELLHNLILIKTSLETIAERSEATIDKLLQQDIAEIKSLIIQIFEKWSPYWNVPGIPGRH